MSQKYEKGILKAFDEGKLKSVATKSELECLKAAARATAISRPQGRVKPRR